MDEPPGSTLLFLAVLLLLAVNAVLVAAEYSLIAVRRTRLDTGLRAGDALAARSLPSPERLEQLAFASQVVRSLASVLLGWLAVLLARAWLVPAWGEGARVELFGFPLGTAEGIATAAGIAVAALAHASLGQQVPKLVALGRADRIAPRLVGPLDLLRRALAPVLWLLGGGVLAAARLLGVREPGFGPLVPSAEELRALMEQVSDDDRIEADEREMIRGVFEFRETVAREVMTPRTEMLAVPVDVAFDELVRLATEEGHSRIPVYEESVDQVVGVLLVKDLLPVLVRRAAGEREPFEVRAFMREPLFVPDTKPVNALLSELRLHGVHLAIVVDEFGGTYGMVTMEDLLEEIVGEIRDEYDEEEDESDFAPAANGDVLIDGTVSVGEVNERFGLRLPEEDFDTLGGYVFGALGRLPVEGDTVVVDGPEGAMELRVEETEERRVAVVRLSRVTEEAAEDRGEPALLRAMTTAAA